MTALQTESELPEGADSWIRKFRLWQRSEKNGRLPTHAEVDALITERNHLRDLRDRLAMELHQTEMIAATLRTRLERTTNNGVHNAIR